MLSIESPAAFGSSYEREAALPMAEWRRLLLPDANPAFVWEDQEGGHGIVVAAQDLNGTDALYLVSL